jgi:hypothetical protein
VEWKSFVLVCRGLVSKEADRRPFYFLSLSPDNVQVVESDCMLRSPDTEGRSKRKIPGKD